MDLLLISFILIIALLAIRISNKVGIPSIIFFIVLGIAFGYAGFGSEDFEFAEMFSTLALIVISFYGGFGTRWKVVREAAKESILLSTIGVIITAVTIGFFAHYALGFKLVEGFLLGAVISSTDAASIFSILRSRHLNLRDRTVSILGLESGSNDVFAKSMTFALMATINKDIIDMPIFLMQLVFVGLIVGVVVALILREIIQKINIEEDGLFAVFIMSVMFFTYAFSDRFGGNGYLAVYVLGIILGDQEFTGKRDLVSFFDGFTGIMQIGLFFLLGIISEPAKLISNLPIAIAIVIFITLVARPVAVFSLLAPFKMPLNKKSLIAFAGFRGSTAIVLAIKCAGIPLGFDLLHIVFGVVITSFVLQTGLLPLLSRKLNMIDSDDSVMKTFNDYQDKGDLGFLQTMISADSPWIGKQVKELKLAFPFIIAKIERDGKNVVARGNTVIFEGDIIVLGGETYFDSTGQNLTEFTLNSNHEWANKKIMDLDLESNKLIIMIQRTDEDFIIPDGKTTLVPGDKIVMLKL